MKNRKASAKMNKKIRRCQRDGVFLFYIALNFANLTHQVSSRVIGTYVRECVRNLILRVHNAAIAAAAAGSRA